MPIQEKGQQSIAGMALKWVRFGDRQQEATA